MHLPFHNFAGPGTHIMERVLAHQQPTTFLDRAALIHDVEYLAGDQFHADNNMWLNLIRHNPLALPIANAVRLGFLLKDVIGYNPEVNRNKYIMLKNLVRNDYDLGKMNFYD